MEQITPTGGSITLVHFTHDIATGVVPEWRIACMPNMVEFHTTVYHTHYQRSNDVRGVSCPACKKSPTFKQAKDRLESALGGPRRAT